MLVRGVSIALALCACTRHDSKPDPQARPEPNEQAAMPSESTTTHNDIALTWKLTKQAKAISVWYRVDNKSKTRIYVADKLLVNMQTTRKWRGVRHLRAEDAGDRVRFVVGPPAGGPAVAGPIMTFIPVDPGASHEESREVALPVTGNKKASKATLAVHMFSGEPPEWLELEGEVEGPIKVPDKFTPIVLESGPLALPK